jgi:hypothetical protein
MMVLYVYQICLFGVTLSLFGKLEEAGRHGLLCYKVNNKKSRQTHTQQSSPYVVPSHIENGKATRNYSGVTSLRLPILRGTMVL